MPHWRILGTVHPTTLQRSRETLHHAAQLLALAGASYREPQGDDSHTSMSWLEPFGALSSQPIAAEVPFRFALRLRDLTLLVIDETSREERAALPLHGVTRDDALAWMRHEVARRGLDDERLRSRLHFAIASHPTDDGRPFEALMDGTLEELASWYSDASFVLENRRRAVDGAGPVRCWPHHFDIATLVRLEPGGPLRTIGIGLSPGDDSADEPYYYVAPYPAPTVRPRPLSIGSWHTSGWWGAALGASAIVKAATAEDQAAMVTHFIDEALECLLAINQGR
ncbi:MAG TPA: hypothetical protein VGJ18_11340 [Gemmatimonadaceae bacterium]|jgi:hypothetical protein